MLCELILLSLMEQFDINVYEFFYKYLVMVYVGGFVFDDNKLY